MPAWLYHTAKLDKSFPLASLIAARKSSHVTAWPSWRWKYRSIPFLKPALPRTASYLPKCYKKKVKEGRDVHADDLGTFVVPARVAVSGSGSESAWGRSEGALAYTVLV